MVAVSQLAQKCTGCDAKNYTAEKHWWYLTGYHGITGCFCPDCYNTVAHDSYGNPEDPAGYMYMLLKLDNSVVWTYDN